MWFDDRSGCLSLSRHLHCRVRVSVRKIKCLSGVIWIKISFIHTWITHKTVVIPFDDKIWTSLRATWVHYATNSHYSLILLMTSDHMRQKITVNSNKINVTPKTCIPLTLKIKLKLMPLTINQAPRSFSPICKETKLIKPLLTHTRQDAKSFVRRMFQIYLLKNNIFLRLNFISQLSFWNVLLPWCLLYIINVQQSKTW